MGEETSLKMAMAILGKLKELEFLKSSKALEKEITKKFSLDHLPLPSSEKMLVLQMEKKPSTKEDGIDDEESTSGSGSTSSSNSSSSSSSSCSSSSSSSSSSSESSHNRSRSSDSSEGGPPTKKAKIDIKKNKAGGIVSPEVYDDNSDSDVSDVEVSSVSTVSTSEDESDSDSSSSSSDSDSASSSSSSESEEEDLEAFHKTKRKKAADKAKEAAKAALAWTPKKMKQSPKDDVKTHAGSDGAQALSTGKPFQRVDDSYWGEKAVQDGGAMADNSYGNVFGNDGFGARSSEKLLQVRGKRFQHEKTKRKRSFNGMSNKGGKINMASNSTKYKYDD